MACWNGVLEWRAGMTCWNGVLEWTPFRVEWAQSQSAVSVVFLGKIAPLLIWTYELNAWGGLASYPGKERYS